MPHIIEELWNGNIAPCDNCGAGDPDINLLVIYIERHKNALLENLSSGQKALLEKYSDCWNEYLLRMSAEAFKNGFCLGTALFAEAYYGK